MEPSLHPGDFVLVSKLAYGLRTPARLPFVHRTFPPATILALGGPARGDVLVLHAQGDGMSDGEKYVKRCVAVAGDTVEVLDGVVRVNERVVRENVPHSPVVPRMRIPASGDLLPCAPGEAGRWRRLVELDGGKVEVRDDGGVWIDGVRSGHYRVRNDFMFVIGDNLPLSSDSRHWGPVPSASAVGKAVIVYWSWDDDLRDASFVTRLSSIRWDRIGSLVR